MRRSAQDANSVHQDTMALNRILRRAEMNTTRPKAKNDEFITIVKKALRILLDDSSSGAPVKRA